MNDDIDREEKGGRRYRLGAAEFAVPPLTPALYLVATPIGNLRDITLRALETLAAADIVAAEDTRVTRVLLARYDLGRRLVAYHEHNAAEAGPKLIAALEGERPWRWSPMPARRSFPIRVIGWWRKPSAGAFAWCRYRELRRCWRR